uniref:mitotic spindle assembly checkpoint protein MAD2B n=1 Tax=Vespula vulgaris TaxID=7454 RepID=UPI002124677F|nr:mitotic spindle assembly checkpoint protein MAD2B [Vespula vulgaris]
MSQSKIVASDILLEFLEVAFNHILYYRKLYPKEIFVKKKIYGAVVHISEQPELNEYLKNVLTAIKELLKEDENSIKAVNLVVFNQNRIPIEKFVFDFVKLQAQGIEIDPYYLKTEEALRTICLKLSICNTYLNPLPEDASFSIEIQTYETAHVSLSENPLCEDFPWIVENEINKLSNKKLLPLNTVETECLNLQMYVLQNVDVENTS